MELDNCFEGLMDLVGLLGLDLDGVDICSSGKASDIDFLGWRGMLAEKLVGRKACRGK